MSTVKIIYLGRRGGGSNYTLMLTKSLIRSGASVDLFISRSNEQLDELMDAGANNYVVTAAHSYFQIITRIGSLFTLCWTLVMQYHPLDERKTPYHFTMFHLWNVPLMILLKLFSREIIFTVHDYTPHLGDGGWIMKALIRLMVKLSDKLVVLNEPVAVQILSANPKVRRDQIVVLPLLSFIEPIGRNRSLPLDGSTITVLFFGRISKYKGIDIFLDSAILALETFPQLKFVIAGSGDMSDYAEKVSVLGSKLVVINRWIAEEAIPQFFVNADVCVLPYLDSTQSGVMPIALSMGVPIVITPSDGLVNQLPDGVGLVADDFSADAVSSAIVEMISNAAQYEKFSTKAFDFSRSAERSWEQQARALAVFYQE